MGNVPVCKRETGPTYYIYDSSNETSRELVDNLEAQVGPYVPPWWYDPHVASVVHMGRPPQIDYRREVLHHPDGTEFSCDWAPAIPPNITIKQAGPQIVIIAPALGGTSGHGYIRTLVDQLVSQGYVCCVLNVRGTEQKLKVPRPFNVADCSDLSLLINHVARNYDHSHLYAIGFSLGGNFVTRYLMESGRNTPLTAALSICNSFNYHKALTFLEQSGSLGSAYSKGFASIFKRVLLKSENRSVLEGHVDVRKLEKIELMSDLDRVVCSPLYGWEDVEAYWQQASQVARLRDINVPFLVLQALDDPVFTNRVREIVPLEEMSANTNIVYMETASGGHFGYVEGDLLEAYSNSRTYTYPARVASTLFSVASRTAPKSPRSVSVKRIIPVEEVGQQANNENEQAAGTAA